MRIPRIYVDQALSIQQNTSLDEAASRHVIKVLRMEVGRRLVLFNGHGGEFQATINSVNKKNVEVKVTDFCGLERESPLSIELAIGVSRGERMDWIVQKATELGVSCITPLFTERTEVKLNGERSRKKVQHWEQIAISACEQCQRNRLPKIKPLQNLTKWLPSTEADHKVVLHHRANSEALKKDQVPRSIALLIGPEGGLSDSEINSTLGLGFSSLSLGPRIFRTETAPIVALSIFQSLWGDF